MSFHQISKPVQWLTAGLLALFSIYLAFTAHGDFVLWLNGRYTAVGDVFFRYWTYVGDGVVLGLVALLFLFQNYYRFFTFLMAIAFQTVFVHLFKQVLFAGELRPQRYFASIIEQLHFVDGVVVRSFNSFPSGHTASAFTLCFFLMLITKRTTVQLSLLLAAVFVGLSRVYILQHFGRDIFFGAIFGILSVLLAQGIMKRYEDRPKLQRGLLKT